MRWAEEEKPVEELRSGLTRPDPAELPGSETRHARGVRWRAVRARLQQRGEREGRAPPSQCVRHLCSSIPAVSAGRQGVDLTLSTCRVT